MKKNTFLMSHDKRTEAVIKEKRERREVYLSKAVYRLARMLSRRRRMTALHLTRQLAKGSFVGCRTSSQQMLPIEDTPSLGLMWAIKSESTVSKIKRE